MKKNILIAYLLALFPLTGLLGIHQLYLGNFKKFFIRIIMHLTIVGGLILWIYDLMKLPEMVRESNEISENKIEEVIELLNQGKLKEASKIFIYSFHTQVYINEIISRGKEDLIVKYFADTKKDKNDLEKLIRKGDTDGLVINLSEYYLNNINRSLILKIS